MWLKKDFKEEFQWRVQGRSSRISTCNPNIPLKNGRFIGHWALTKQNICKTGEAKMKRYRWRREWAE